MTPAQKPGRTADDIYCDIAGALGDQEKLESLCAELAALTPPHATADAGAGVREQIARIVDPAIWQSFDYYNPENGGRKPGGPRTKSEITFVNPSLAIADEIIASGILRPDAGNADYARACEDAARAIEKLPVKPPYTAEAMLAVALRAVRALPQPPAREDGFESIQQADVTGTTTIDRGWLDAEPAREDAPIPAAVEQRECVSDEQRTTWRKLADEATPGPWKLWAMSVMADPVGQSNYDDALLVAHTSDPQRGLRTHNAQFIAAARTAVPALLAAIDAAETALRDERARVERLEEALRPLAAAYNEQGRRWDCESVTLTVGDVRRARAVLTPGSEAQEGRS